MVWIVHGNLFFDDLMGRWYGMEREAASLLSCDLAFDGIGLKILKKVDDG